MQTMSRIMTTMTAEMQRCIQACSDCHRLCLEEAMHHCLELAGEHTQPDHFRLMLTCAEMCQTTADMLSIGSPGYESMCGVCADVGEACALSCEALGDMEACAEACRRCADLCRALTG